MTRADRSHVTKRSRKLCAGCRERIARFRYEGEVRADHDHTLCFECYRAAANRTRALCIWTGGWQSQFRWSPGSA